MGRWVKRHATGRTPSKHCDRLCTAFFLNAMKEIYNNDASLSIHFKKIHIVETGGINFKATKYILPSTSTVGELRLRIHALFKWVKPCPITFRINTLEKVT